MAATTTTQKAPAGKPTRKRPLDSALVRLWTKGLADSHAFAIRVAGGPPLPFDPTTPAGKAIYREVADRIEGIEAETQARVRKYVARARLEGLSPEGLANLIRADPSKVFDRSRARTIARTESGMAYNRGSILGYRDSGRVKQVRVFDGDGCTWPDGHGDGPEADGMIVDLDEAEQYPLAHPNCFSGDTLVVAPNVRAAFTRWFEGEVVVLRTAADDLLTCTPNHPILTDQGWIAAGLIQEGDHVVRCLDAQRVAALVDPDNDHVPARIEEVARAVLKSGQRPPATMPSAAVAFHGDGAGSDVYVVGADGLGENGRNACALKHGRQVSLALADVGLVALLAGGYADAMVNGLLNPADCVVSGGRVPLPLSGCELRIPEQLGVGAGTENIPAALKGPAQRGTIYANTGPDGARRFSREVAGVENVEIKGQPHAAWRAQLVPGLLEESGQAGGADAYALCDRRRTLSGLVAEVQVINVERRQFAGHVFNLETGQGWYVADNIIAHNCVRGFAPVVESAGGAE